MTNIPATESQTDASPGGQERRLDEALSETRQTVAQETAHFAEGARQVAGEQLEEGRQTAVSTLGGFADAIRKAGDELGEKDQSFGAQMARQAADGLEGLSRAISDKRPEDLMRAVQDFGRHNPTAFLAGAVLAGVALGRFARASTHHAQPNQGVTNAGHQSSDDRSAREAREAAAQVERTGIADQSPAFAAHVELAPEIPDPAELSGGDGGVDALSGDAAFNPPTEGDSDGRR